MKDKNYITSYKRIGFAVLIFLISVLFVNFENQSTNKVNASDKETANLRIIGTTDLHGQLNSTDYEKGTNHKNYGLARVFDLIKKARDEVGIENTITVDAGDSLYDYTTEFIFSENQYAVQPIYQAMAEIGYDAITLGNHDFDYGYEYILRQLAGSGLMDITVLSNVMDSKTGDFPFLENMLITKVLKTNEGREVAVKIGIIGQTIPTLTAKTHSYAGILKTEDMVINATHQSAKLKEMGADIVIAISHTGIGPESPELNFKNVAYALTKIPNIDVVVAGHEHNLYPTTNMSSAYYKLPEVDKETYLMNGKNVIMAGNRGAALGIVDLTLEFYNDSIQIGTRKSEIREVTEIGTKEDKNIAEKFGSWEKELLNYLTEVIGKLPEGVAFHNYFGLMGDSSSIQLLNDAKINYGLKYINTTGKEYQDLPVIAASNYFYFGENSVDEFIDIRNTFTEADISTIQPYNNYLYLYRITGKQLKEWLEWSASAYETTTLSKKWTDLTISKLKSSTNLNSLLREEWINNWRNFYIFDGVHYEINAQVEPRYNIAGTKVSNNNRIRNLTYNGKPVTETMEFIIATDKITKPNTAIKGVDTQRVLGGFVRGQSVLGDYIKQKHQEGNLLPQLDYNWKVNLGVVSKFIAKVPAKGQDLFTESQWFEKFLLEEKGYQYYVGSYRETLIDNLSPHLVVTPLITDPTASPYDIIVKAYDESGIKTLKILSGDYDINYTGWNSGKDITSSNFKVSKNGTYSIFVEDTAGNKGVTKIKVENFSDNLLRKPTVVSYTNRKTKITGTGEPNTTVIIEAHTGIYRGLVDSKGAFSYALPGQPSGSEVAVYMKEEEKGIESEKVRVTVKRTGPNQPYVYPIYNNANYIMGTTDELDATIVAIVDEIAYVSHDGGKELFEKNTDVYTVGLEIVPVEITIYDTGYFVIQIPPQSAKDKISIYTLDHLSRSSRVSSLVVEDLGPNAPEVYEITNIERTLTGFVPSNKNKIYDVSIEIADNIYRIKTNNKGEFSLDFDDQLYAGQEIEVTAYDTIDGIRRSSYVLKVIVSDIESYITTASSSIELYDTTIESFYIDGTYEGSGKVQLAFANGTGKEFTNVLTSIEVGDDGIILYDLVEMLEAGTTVYAMVRFTNGTILDVNKTIVSPLVPMLPTLVKEVTNSTKSVEVITDKDSVVTLTIGNKKYTTEIYQYNEKRDAYIYTFAVDRSLTGTGITMSATNLGGSSEIATGKVIKTAPEVTKVQSLKAKETVITGTLDLARDKASVTKIYAMVGTKTIEGTVGTDGKFTIKVSSLKKGANIKIWSVNSYGRGPQVTAVVGK